MLQLSSHDSVINPGEQEEPKEKRKWAYMQCVVLVYTRTPHSQPARIQSESIYLSSDGYIKRDPEPPITSVVLVAKNIYIYKNKK